MSAPRFFALDALRSGLMVLWIVLHSAMFYWSAPPPTVPFLFERHTAYGFDLVVSFIHGFRMPAFFVLSGFLAALLVAQRGLARFYHHRGRRVFLPLVVALVTILPLAGYGFVQVILSARFGARSWVLDREQLITLANELTVAGFPIREPAVDHLWFLFYLIYFSLLLPLWRLVERGLEPFEARLRGWLGSGLAVVGLGLICAVTLWPFRGGQVFEGVVLLKPQPAPFVYYGAFFFFGCLLHRHREVFAALVRLAPENAVAGGLLFPLAQYATEIEYAAGAAVSPAVHLAAVVAQGLCTWTLIYAMTGFALRYCAAESPWALYLCRASFWVYLVHPILICGVVYGLQPIELHAVFKFGVVVAVATIASFLSYHYLVQRSWIGTLLNGQRFNQAWPWQDLRAATRKRVAP
ncbi:MAG: acyltransferase family protein [Opitutae bacterium]|nr:acyltransferase family protein [Opitutae bacterium]